MTRRITQAVARLIPVAGWIGGALGWVLTHQIGSDFVQLNCKAADPLVMVVIGLCGAVLAVGGGLLSFRHWRNSHSALDHDHAGTTRFLAALSAMAAAIFLGAILFQTLASLIIPQCHA